MKAPTIVVFDLGKVLVDFDYTIAARKIAARSQKSPAEIKVLIEQSRFIIDYEIGRMTRREFYEQVRGATGFGAPSRNSAGFSRTFSRRFRR